MDIGPGMGKVGLHVDTDKIGQIAILTQFNTNRGRGISKASFGKAYWDKTNKMKQKCRVLIQHLYV